ncbi:hypothetical protein M405DRAFT_847505 [Rhizopogon salebrosus TDB-379]|nr:hypothetical protein M405DRAFT_847505 [Rhizopogon salebrosus TDB-379]
MHHALLIPDVRAYIFDSIKKDKQASRRTFAMLARTCRDLSEASLDALWGELHSLRPLASCIYMANTTLGDESIAEPDLTIFCKYAHRVRKLDVSGQLPGRHLRRSGRYPDVTDEFGALLYYKLPFPLLPNLRHLAWAPATGLNLLLHLLGPHLLSLKIPSSHWVPEASIFVLAKIPRLCPKIKSLTLQIHGTNQPTTLHPRESAQLCIPQVICSWERLEELDCNPLTSEGFLRLSVLSSLRILRLQVITQSVVNLPPDSLSFPSLHTLCFQADTLETAIVLVKAMKRLPKTLKIDTCTGNYRRVSCSREAVGLFLGLIGDASHCELQNFTMSLPFLLGDDALNVSDMLRPLFLCCELRTLCMRLISRFTLGDDDLSMMAIAWPLLEELELIDVRPRRIVTPNPPPPNPPPPLVPATPTQPAQLPQPSLTVPVAGPVVTPHLSYLPPQPPVDAMGPGQPTQLPQPSPPAPPAVPAVTLPPPHLQPQEPMTAVNPGQPIQLPQTPPAAGPVVTPFPPHIQPQPPMTTMDPGQPIQLPQTPPPVPVAGPAQIPQLQNPLPVIYPHMIPGANFGQPIHFQHLPVIPPPNNAAFPVAFANHSLSVRSRTAEITFHGLISLLDRCPNLYYFDLAIDATKLDGLDGRNPGGGVCNRLVKVARLIDSPVGDPDAVARILLDILPELDDVVGSNVPHNMTPQGWVAVRQRMIASRQARTELDMGA